MKKIDPKLFEPYGQILFFLQKGQDLDTSGAAYALLTLVKNKFPNKEVGIVGITMPNKVFPGINAFKVSDVDKLSDKTNTLGIFCDIANSKQVGSPRFIALCKHICIFDHHEKESPETWDEKTTKRIMWQHSDPSYSSCCELLWDLIDKDKFEITKEVATYLCWGLVSDTLGLITPTTNKRTFEILAEINATGINVAAIIRDQNRLNWPLLKVFCETIQNHTIQKGKVLFMNLCPKVVRDNMPYCFRSNNKSEKISQNKCFTYLINQAEKLIKADVFILAHYSLYHPYDQNRKVIYVVLSKPNAICESILKTNGFIQNRNRWTYAKGMNLETIYNLIFNKFGNEFGANKQPNYDTSNK